MADYVRSYLQLEDRAIGAESKSDEYRWEQCRVTHNAVESGAYTQTSFAKATGVGQSVISRQCRAFDRFYSQANRPAYRDAIARIDGATSAEAETDRKKLTTARTVFKDKALAEELLSDPEVCVLVEEALLGAHDRRTAGKKPAKPLNERWAAWANRATTLVIGGAKLADETDNPDKLDAHAALGYMVYERIVERQLDAEIRSLMDTADVE